MHDFLQLPAYEKAKELLEKEKQQIIDAVNKTDEDNCKKASRLIFSYTNGKNKDAVYSDGKDGETYYNQTFKN